ncbi:Stealth CR1 domain-containing protein [Liquorilactobacillus mali]|uniref:Stealth CR1 domain-containing protein n=1 Tax=Liquorilactobacillus mali TaxID=1618 RepID=UPI002952A4B5|nr:Stealth CR1 domain-containing protein [Liquorilactobacillus mali]MDV7757568.1 hypothetical protein [Liquorilactobacillus mali]
MDIDIVVLWVDGNDTNWKNQKNKYLKLSPLKNVSFSDFSESRFRDWGFMRYWFRGIEKFAPWIRKIHFVTWGHVPEFLDVSNDKIHIVNHKDIIEEKYLPTFNSCAIEININKIKGLSEQFIYFNDDQFLINNVSKKDFFVNGLPCEEGLQGTITSVGDKNSYCHQLLNDIDIINRNFNKKRQINKNLSKWFNLKYRINMIRNIMLYPWENFTGFKNSHLPVPVLKSTMENVWAAEYDVLNKTTADKFRSFYDVNQYVFRYWQLAEGKFYPRNSIGKMYEIHDDNVEVIAEKICNSKLKTICLNDPNEPINFERCKRKLQESFDKVLNEKCEFEKDY